MRASPRTAIAAPRATPATFSSTTRSSELSLRRRRGRDAGVYGLFDRRRGGADRAGAGLLEHLVFVLERLEIRVFRGLLGLLGLEPRQVLFHLRVVELIG